MRSIGICARVCANVDLTVHHERHVSSESTTEQRARALRTRRSDTRTGGERGNWHQSTSALDTTRGDRYLRKRKICYADEQRRALFMQEDRCLGKYAPRRSPLMMKTKRMAIQMVVIKQFSQVVILVRREKKGNLSDTRLFLFKHICADVLSTRRNTEDETRNFLLVS